jgi:hypothetical protein
MKSPINFQGRVDSTKPLLQLKIQPNYASDRLGFEAESTCFKNSNFDGAIIINKSTSKRDKTCLFPITHRDEKLQRNPFAPGTTLIRPIV